jgi:hypothetical protein
MEIDRLMIEPGAPVFYDQAFRNVLEDHLTLLRSSERTRERSVEPMVAYKFEGDFFGLLAHHGIQPYLHWVIMRLNGMTSPVQASREITSFWMPDPAEISRLRGAHMTARKIN